MKRYFIPALALAVLTLGRVPAGVSQMQVYNDADSRELQAFRLTDDLVERYRSATMAFVDWGKAHPEAKDPDDKDDEKKKASDITISDMAAHMSSKPQFQAILISKGITARQYFETMLVLVTAMAAVDMEREGQKVGTVQGVSPANLDYVKRNHDHLTVILKQMAGTDQ
jgi:hypothetical protein